MTLKKMRRVRVLPYREDVAKLRELFIARGMDVDPWDVYGLYREFCANGWIWIDRINLKTFVEWSLQYLEEETT